MRRLILSLLLLAVPVISFGFTQCRTITIANVDDPVARLITHIDQYILQMGYGCDVRLVSGDNVSTVDRMISTGQPDILPALWLNDAKKTVEQGVTNQRLLVMGNATFPGGEEGFWVPSYMVRDYGEYASIAGIKQEASTFARPGNADRGVFYGCRLGWPCQTTVSQLFKALRLGEAKFDQITPFSAASFDQILASLYEKEQPWFGYYRSPSAMLAKYPMSKVSFGSGVSEDEYFNCTVNPACTTPKITMYPNSAIQTVVTYGFAVEAGDVFSYLKNRTLTHPQLNAMLVWMQANNVSDEIAARHFLMNYEETWRPWVPRLIIGKVRRSLYPR